MHSCLELQPGGGAHHPHHLGGGAGAFRQCVSPPAAYSAARPDVQPWRTKVDRLASLQGASPPPTPAVYSKGAAALVWGGSEGRVSSSSAMSGPLAGASAGPASPSSAGLVHWMSVMADHDVHYMWNGVETKTNASDQHGTPPLQKESSLSSYHKGLLCAKEKTTGPSSPHDSRPQHHNFRWPHSSGHGTSLEEGRGGSSLDSGGSGGGGGGGGAGGGAGHLPSGMYGGAPGSGGPRPGPNGSNNNGSSAGGGASPSSQQQGSMLVVPQPLKGPPSNGTASQHHGPPSSVRKYQCKMCPQMFGAKAELQLHSQSHLREAKPYRCGQCSKAFANASYLSQHARIHLGIKPYRCEMCGRKFTQLSHLQQHVRTHTGDKPYKCRHPDCSKAFSQLSNLQSHSRCHQADKPFKCNSCYKCFSDEGSLLEHIPRHRDSKHLKTHICHLCGKSYTQETYLVKHMHKHADRAAAHAARASPPEASEAAFWQQKVPEGLDEGDHSPPDCQLQAGAGCDSRLQHLATRGSLADDPYGPDSPTAGVNAATTTAAAKGATSAFTPIQSSNQGPNAGRGGAAYFQYDPFPAAAKQPQQAQEQKGSSFPSQLISLHQIRSFASMPSMAADQHHPITLGGKDASKQ
ncbi:unnamed protein product [Ixodes persulcatus]